MSYSDSAMDHAICVPCWVDSRPERIPHRVVDDVARACCFCGRPTSSGVYLRQEPSITPCQGVHRA